MPAKFGITAGRVTPFAGLFVEPVLAVAENPPFSRQIPPDCTVDPKLPRPATQLDFRVSPSATLPFVPSAPLLATGIAFRAPKLPRPADQLDAPPLARDGFVPGELAVESELDEAAPPGCQIPNSW
ncbi:MAG: hypothetical protein ABSD59_13060 [Terracidiphilus sp.]